MKKKHTLNFDPRLAKISATGTLNLGVYNRNKRNTSAAQIGQLFRTDKKKQGSEINLDTEKSESLVSQNHFNDDSQSILDAIEEKEGMNI